MSSDRKGFTLIEVLISLALLTIVLGALYSSFFSVQRAVDRFDDVSLKYHEARTALDIMRREIEAALLKNPRTADDTVNDATVKAAFVIRDRDIFGSNTSSLELTAYSFRGNNPKTVSYYVEKEDGRLNLKKTETLPLLPSKGYTMEVVEDIEGFTVETLFNNKWVKTWDTADTGRLPDVVRVTIEFDDNGRTVNLTEYARPRVGRRL
ncbi:MAG: prepilin-type N-terminal cleavage/methylation domain-containing protein [Deferribacteres bacterium]|nr:prepilin-type N-terminal cleavage/methylation domain-containing protein [Deferribacteres bacterium]